MTTLDSLRIFHAPMPVDAPQTLSPSWPSSTVGLCIEPELLPMVLKSWLPANPPSDLVAGTPDSNCSSTLGSSVGRGPRALVIGQRGRIKDKSIGCQFSSTV